MGTLEQLIESINLLNENLEKHIRLMEQHSTAIQPSDQTAGQTTEKTADNNKPTINQQSNDNQTTINQQSDNNKTSNQTTINQQSDNNKTSNQTSNKSTNQTSNKPTNNPIETPINQPQQNNDEPDIPNSQLTQTVKNALMKDKTLMTNLREYLQEQGVSKVSELPQDQRRAFIDFMEGLV